MAGRSIRPVRARGLLAAFAALLAGHAAARAGGAGALDVEIANRSRITGAIGLPGELDTMRLRMLPDAELSIALRGAGKLTPDVAVLGPGDTPIDIGPHVTRAGRNVTISGLVPGAGGLYRIDVRDQATATGNYRLDAQWRLPDVAAFAGMTASQGAFFVFDADKGTRLDIRISTPDPGGSVYVLSVSGPRGYGIEYSPPTQPFSAVRVVTPPLPSAGRYRLDMATDVGGRNVVGEVIRKTPRKLARVNLKRAERKKAGVARTLSRVIDEEGGDVAVPDLDEKQRVSLDSTGVCLAIPSGAVSFPTSFLLRTEDDEIDDPLGFTPAGVSVHFDAGGAQFNESLQVTLPYDAGAFDPANVGDEICVLRLADDGQVYEIPRASYAVDANAGTVTFPASSFSSYQVFSPPIELAEIAVVGAPNDLSVAPNGSDLYLTSDVLTSDAPVSTILRYVPGGELERYAGGGVLTGDFVQRLEFDFDRDMGFDGVLMSALSVSESGFVLVVTGDLQRTRSVVYVITPDGFVVRAAGDGTAVLDESSPARETGLPFCCGATVLDNGNAVLVTDSFPYPVSDRVLHVYSDGPGLDDIRIETLAGGGTVDVSGADPLDTRLLQPRAVFVDSQSRILVGDRDWLVRFDVNQRTTTTLAGTNFGETDAGDGSGKTIGGVGAPLRTVVLGALDDLAFAPGREDILYAADPEAGIVWRFDLVRDRAFIAAGRRVNFERRLTTRAPDPRAVNPGDQLSFPVAVAPLGDDVFIAERFDNRLFSLRRRAQ